MATVIIPETGRGDNPLTIYINGVKYSLPRGEEVTVSDAVAAEIQALGGDLLPVSEEPLSDGAHLPRATASDDGKVAKYVDGQWVPADGGGSGGGVLVVHDEDGTLDKTWQEIADADFAVLKTVGADPDNDWDEGSVAFNVVKSAAVLTDNNDYSVTFGFDEYHTDSASGYPAKTESGDK